MALVCDKLDRLTIVHINSNASQKQSNKSLFLASHEISFSVHRTKI